MSDKPQTAAAEKGASDSEAGLFDQAFDYLKSGYESLRSSWTGSDSGSSNTTLEEKGTLPKVELNDGNKEAGPAQKKDASAESAEPTIAARVEKPPERTSKEIVTSPESSQEDKLKAANELAKSGETSFSGPDGRNYYISVTDLGSRNLVSIHTRGEDGRSHAVLRGIASDDGSMARQRDSSGQEVPYLSRWAERNLADSPVAQGPERAEQTAERAEDKGESAAEAVPTAEAFLKEHPEMQLSPAAESRLRKERETLEAEHQRDAVRLEEVRAAGEKLSAVVRDLKKDGVNVDDPDKFKEDFAKLPEDKQEAYQKRFDELKPYAQDLTRLTELSGRVELQERRLYDIDQRLGFKEDLEKIDRLPPEQRKVVYESLDRILDKGDKTQTTGLTDAQRKQIAQDVVHQIAHPEDIKQGNKNTCALASSEFVLAQDHPDVYARAVAEIATTGELTTFGDGQVEPGKGIKISMDDIHKDDGNPERSLASKIFQTAAATLAVSDDGARYENYKPGQVPENRAVNSGTTPADDSGERLVFMKDGQEVVRDWPGLYADDQVEVLSKLTGKEYQAEKIYAHGAEHFQEQLAQKAAEHGYPLKVSFLLMDGSGHAVSVTGIDSSREPPVVIYEDPAKPRGKPQELSVQDFYRLALTGGSVYAAGGQKLQILATGPGADPYVQIIHD